MELRTIIYLVFVVFNSMVLFRIYFTISRWMKRMEDKINGVEHAVLSVDDYIKFNKHTTDIVYLNYLEGLKRVFVSKEMYEEADMLNRVIKAKEKIVKDEINERYARNDETPSV